MCYCMSLLQEQLVLSCLFQTISASEILANFEAEVYHLLRLQVAAFIEYGAYVCHSKWPI